jgi:soluble lytic murein transglycosylase
MQTRKKMLPWAVLFTLFVAILFSQSTMLLHLIYPVKYKDSIVAVAKQTGVDPYLIAAMIRVESNYKAEQISARGAIGLMQLLPQTATYVIEHEQLATLTSADLKRADANIAIGGAYLSILQRTFAKELQGKDNNSQVAMLAVAYNAGPGTTRNWLNERVWDGTYAHVAQLRIGETRHYVQRVVYYYNKYRKIEVFEGQ